MVWLSIQYLAIQNNRNLPNSIKYGQIRVQNFAKY